MDASLPVVAGAVSTMIFVCSTLPMLVKAARTKDLGSYSLGNILLSNVGNLVNTLYVVHLPVGPVWALHGFHLVTTGLMLYWYVRYVIRRRHPPRRSWSFKERVGEAGGMSPGVARKNSMIESADWQAAPLTATR